jgi:hypothetical protein
LLNKVDNTFVQILINKLTEDIKSGEIDKITIEKLAEHYNLGKKNRDIAIRDIAIKVLAKLHDDKQLVVETVSGDHESFFETNVGECNIEESECEDTQTSSLKQVETHQEHTTHNPISHIMAIEKMSRSDTDTSQLSQTSNTQTSTASRITPFAIFSPVRTLLGSTVRYLTGTPSEITASIDSEPTKQEQTPSSEVVVYAAQPDPEQHYGTCEVVSYGEDQIPILQCSFSNNSIVYVFPKFPTSPVDTTYTLDGYPASGVCADGAVNIDPPTCRPIEFHGQPSVTCEGDKATVVYTPYIAPGPFANLGANIMLGATVVHMMGQTYSWIKSKLFTTQPVPQSTHKAINPDYFYAQMDKFKDQLQSVKIQLEELSKYIDKDELRWGFWALEEFNEDLDNFPKEFHKGLVSKSQLTELHLDIKHFIQEVREEAKYYQAQFFTDVSDNGHLRRVDVNHWYRDDDITTILRITMQNQLEGYASPDNSYLLRSEADGRYSEGNTTERYFVAVTPAVDVMSGAAPITFYFDRNQQQPPDMGHPDQRRDVFDELMPVLTEGQQNHAKILFPYNITQVHWLMGEIRIHRDGHQYLIEFFAHDPYGGGRMQSSNVSEFEEAIIRRLTEFDPEATFNFAVQDSPYNKRQTRQDGTSCGVITVADIARRARGEGLDVVEPYPIGAPGLRKAHIQMVEQYLPEDDPTRIKFVTRNTIRNADQLPVHSETVFTAASFFAEQKNGIVQKTTSITTPMPVSVHQALP